MNASAENPAANAKTTRTFARIYTVSGGDEGTPTAAHYLRLGAYQPEEDPVAPSGFESFTGLAFNAPDQSLLVSTTGTLTLVTLGTAADVETAEDVGELIGTASGSGNRVLNLNAGGSGKDVLQGNGVRIAAVGAGSATAGSDTGAPAAGTLTVSAAQTLTLDAGNMLKLKSDNNAKISTNKKYLSVSIWKMTITLGLEIVYVIGLKTKLGLGWNTSGYLINRGRLRLFDVKFAIYEMSMNSVDTEKLIGTKFTIPTLKGAMLALATSGMATIARSAFVAIKQRNVKLQANGNYVDTNGTEVGRKEVGAWTGVTYMKPM